MTSRTPPEDVILIPKEFLSLSTLKGIVERYKGNRLEALQRDPNAFSSTYGRESQFAYETWLSRLENPLSKTFVAVEDKDPTPEQNIYNPVQRLLESEWLGQATLLGPKVLPQEGAETSKPWQVFSGTNLSEGPDFKTLGNAHATYLIVGVFVLPDRRRKGHGRRLIERALMAARDEAKSASAARATVGIIVESGNNSARRLYERIGFKIQGEELAVGGSEPLPVIGMTKDIDIESEHPVFGVCGAVAQ